MSNDLLFKDTKKDYFPFSPLRADIIDYGNAFNLTKYLENESDYIVWSRVASSITYVWNMLSNDAELAPKFQVNEPFQADNKPIYHKIDL